MMKVSEKSLELNVGAELLDHLRRRLNMPKTYLRGLTQKEEKQEGVDFYVNLRNSRMFAFQFKAPVSQKDDNHFQFRLNQAQHSKLHQLARKFPNSVYYVLPFYFSTDKLIRDVPDLARDTWLLRVFPIAPRIFKGQKTKTVNSFPGLTYVNPDFSMINLPELDIYQKNGIEPEAFIEWYRSLREHEGNIAEGSTSRLNPMIVRGLRVAIVGDQQE